MKKYLATSLTCLVLSAVFQFTEITYKEIGIMEGAVINYGLMVMGAFAYLYHVDYKIKQARQ